MKEMVYSDERKCEILESGVYLDHRYAILNLGTHPMACVEIKLNCKDKNDCRLEALDVHGGITFCGPSKWPRSVGWDYAHFGDRYGARVSPDEHSWTTEEILAEIKHVIEQLISAGLPNEREHTLLS